MPHLLFLYTDLFSTLELCVLEPSLRAGNVLTPKAVFLLVVLLILFYECNSRQENSVSRDLPTPENTLKQKPRFLYPAIAGGHGKNPSRNTNGEIS